MPTQSAHQLHFLPASAGGRAHARLSTAFDMKIQEALDARRQGAKRHAYHAARAAESMFNDAYPALAERVTQVGSRKGKSGEIAMKIASRLNTDAVASLAALWSVRNARYEGIRKLFRCAAQNGGFGTALRRVLGSQAEVQHLVRTIKWARSITA